MNDLEYSEEQKENLLLFTQTVSENFDYLIFEYGYKIIDRKFYNPFTVEYTNESNSIIIEGISWGFAATVRINCYNFAKEFTIFDLIAVLNSNLAYPENGQHKQIIAFGKILREIGTDILKNNYEIVPKIIQQVEKIITEFKNVQNEEIEKLFKNGGLIATYSTDSGFEFEAQFESESDLIKNTEIGIGKLDRIFKNFEDYKKSEE